MKSLEMKSEPSMVESMSSSFPRFYVCDDQMPELADWEVDTEYTVTFKIRMTSKNERVDVDDVDTDASFEMTAYEVA